MLARGETVLPSVEAELPGIFFLIWRLIVHCLKWLYLSL